MASSVNLGDALEAFIDDAVKNGRYGSRSEVLREGVRLVQEREALWRKFEAEIQKGLDSIDRGGGVPIDEAFERVRQKLDSRHQKQAA